MGCTMISAGGLMVLILASIFTNMKMTSGISSTEQNNDIHTISTIPSINVITPTHDPTMPDNQFIGANFTEPNPPATYNCTISTYKVVGNNCSTNESTTSGLMLPENVTDIIVTYRDFKEYKYYTNVMKVAPYASNIPGMITNTLTIIVAANIKPRHTSEFYMIALGIADFIASLTRCTYQLWVKYKTDETNSVSCKVPQYIVHISLVYSNMILMSWTIERFIAVIFPMKLATWCSLRNTKITIFLLLLLSSLLGVVYLTELDVYSYWNGKVTVNVCFQTKFMISVWNHVQSLYYVYIPVICVCACNIAILCRLSAMTQARINMASNTTIIDKKNKENRRMTILLLTISGCFLLLHIPYVLTLIFDYIYPDPGILISEDPHFFAKFILYQACAYQITEYQNSVNFFLYCISGSKFRVTFRKLFCKHLTATKGPKEMSSAATRSTNF